MGDHLGVMNRRQHRTCQQQCHRDEAKRSGLSCPSRGQSQHGHNRDGVRPGQKEA
jgi:hypothetical protein